MDGDSMWLEVEVAEADVAGAVAALDAAGLPFAEERYGAWAKQFDRTITVSVIGDHTQPGYQASVFEQVARALAAVSIEHTIRGHGVNSWDLDLSARPPSPGEDG